MLSDKLCLFDPAALRDLLKIIFRMELPVPPPPVRVLRRIPEEPPRLVDFLKDISFKLGEPPHAGAALLAAFSIAIEVCTTPEDTLRLGNLTVVEMQQVVAQVANKKYLPDLDLSCAEKAMIDLTRREPTPVVMIMRHGADCYIRCFLPSAVEVTLLEQILENVQNKLAVLKGSARETTMSPTQVTEMAAAADDSAINAARTLQDLPMGRSDALHHALVLATAGSLNLLF